MSILDELEKPTLLVNPNIARQNIAFMAGKARNQGIRFRPHFKTHQSAIVGEWFREEGVTAITVSSVDMALYFSDHGWDDILIAFPVNIRQMRAIDRLAGHIRLGLLVESVDSVQALAAGLTHPVDLWLKIDSGSGRTGLAWDHPAKVLRVIDAAASDSRFRMRGLLTHAGYTYAAASREEICSRYQASVARMLALQSELSAAGKGRLEVSVGDTPGCTVCDDLGKVNEVRPGNFVFYDGQMLRLGVCNPQQVAAVLACPVVALHPERGEVVVYGGAVHLSKDTVAEEGLSHYGYVVTLAENGGWSAPIHGAYTARLSQEHGILHMPAAAVEKLDVGDWVGIMPAHVCLTVAALGDYRLLDEREVFTGTSSAPA